MLCNLKEYSNENIQRELLYF